MERERSVLRCWALLCLALLLMDGVLSSHQYPNKTCPPSRCGIFTNISPPFRLRHDPHNCGLPDFELACENNLTFFHLLDGKFRVLEINYETYTIRLVDPGIQAGNLSSLPRYFLFRSNFSRTSFLNTGYQGFDYKFRHMMYLKCSDPVREMERLFPDLSASGYTVAYVDTAPYVNWGSKGGGHVYAVVGDLEAHHLKSGCSVKMVTPIALDWHSLLPGGENFSYAHIHREVLPYGFEVGFEVTWWQRACNCPNDTYCDFIPENGTLLCLPFETIQMDSSGTICATPRDLLHYTIVSPFTLLIYFLKTHF